MKKVLFFPPAYASSQAVLIDMPDTAAAALVASGAGAYPISFGGAVGIAPAPTPTIVATPSAASIQSNAAAGSFIANITNVPSGVAPSVAPNDGRFAIAGDAANGWKLVTGLSALSAGTVSVGVNASGAIGTSVALTITAAAAGTMRLATSGTEDPSNFAPLGSTNTLIQYRTRHVVMEDCTSLTLDEALFYVDGASYGDVSYLPSSGDVFNAALEIETAAAGAPSAAFAPFAFRNGAATYVSAGNETTGWFSSDALPASAFGLAKFSKGDVLWLRRGWQFAATRSWLCNDASEATNPTSGEAVRGATDASFNKVNGSGAFSGTAGTALASSRFLRPMALRGVHSGPAVKHGITSIDHGKGGNRNGDGSNATTTGGAYTRALFLAGIAGQKSGRDGNRISNLTAAKMPFRLAQFAAGMFTHFYCEGGTNDLNDPANTATKVLDSLDSAVTLLKTQWPTLKVVWDGILARTNSTDAYATLGAQTVFGKDGANQFGPNPAAGTGFDIVGAFRAGLNARVASGVLHGVTNANAGWADAGAAYLVRVNGAASYSGVDGTHASLALQNLIATALSTQLPTAINIGGTTFP